MILQLLREALAWTAVAADPELVGDPAHANTGEMEDDDDDDDAAFFEEYELVSYKLSSDDTYLSRPRHARKGRRRGERRLTERPRDLQPPPAPKPPAGRFQTPRLGSQRQQHRGAVGWHHAPGTRP